MINCNGCSHKKEAGAEGYCEMFDHMPQIAGECASHSMHLAARAEAKVSKRPGANKPTGEYLHLKDIPIVNVSDTAAKTH